MDFGSFDAEAVAELEDPEAELDGDGELIDAEEQDAAAVRAETAVPARSVRRVSVDPGVRDSRLAILVRLTFACVIGHPSPGVLPLENDSACPLAWRTGQTVRPTAGRIGPGGGSGRYWWR